ncbi:uncharacterized protein LOC107434465 [Ziziphus jujuba]|uniref:Uncharacterized protein LOC107434465 n=1 Tax=Ziziphus jujuba TaxID=326968 RepID=A0A6P4AZ78_ZIZJJ|nr:uncharacterized protein LOC107434465 [Ziziphus jujuba]
MKKSPVYPKCETNDDYDPHADFNQFLQQAKHYARESNLHNPPAHQEEEEEAGKTRRLNEEKMKKKKKKKKQWKKIFLPWWKMGGEKGKPRMELSSANKSNVCDIGRSRGYVSGPIVDSSGNKATDGRHRRPTSGPLASLFNPTRKAEKDIPYMCLNQLASPRGGQSYGPVYTV